MKYMLAIKIDIILGISQLPYFIWYARRCLSSFRTSCLPLASGHATEPLRHSSQASYAFFNFNSKPRWPVRLHGDSLWLSWTFCDIFFYGNWILFVVRLCALIYWRRFALQWSLNASFVLINSLVIKQVDTCCYFWSRAIVVLHEITRLLFWLNFTILYSYVYYLGTFIMIIFNI